MTTIEDFKNAPIGATATHPLGNWVMKTDNDDESWITPVGSYFSDELIESRGYKLDRPTPTTAREALDLAWELAHPVKEGQIVPKGSRYLAKQTSGLKECTAVFDIKMSPGYAPALRTLDPLPDPEPDWLDAPAVFATTGWCAREIWLPQTDGQWKCTCCHSESHWSNLEDVTPLHPKEK